MIKFNSMMEGLVWMDKNYDCTNIDYNIIQL